MQGYRTAAPAAPARTVAQRKAALAKANRIRTRKANLKKDLKKRRVTLTDLLLEPNPPEHLQSARLLELLLATPKIGKTKANKLLVQSRIAPSKTIAGATERQRTELASYIAPR